MLALTPLQQHVLALTMMPQPCYCCACSIIVMLSKRVGQQQTTHWHDSATYVGKPSLIPLWLQQHDGPKSNISAWPGVMSVSCTPTCLSLACLHHLLQEAYARRGAHWTFDAAAFVDCIHRIKTSGKAIVPSFDHGVGDPVPDDITITKDNKVVLVEGNYLLLQTEPWSRLQQLLDDTWFVDCDLDLAMQRVFDRQVSIGLAPEVSRMRIAGNDRPNAELISDSRKHARVVVPSHVPLRSSAVQNN